MAIFPQSAGQENVSTTLNGAITSVAVSIIVNNAANLLVNSYIVLDRVDASGALQATSLWEYCLITAISSNTLTVTRAQGGSTGQAHSNAAVVEAVVTASGWTDARSSYLTEHTSVGGHAMVSVSSITQMFVSSVASIAQANITSLYVSNVTLTTSINASGASIIGMFPSGASGGVLTNIGNNLPPVYATSAAAAGGATVNQNALAQTIDQTVNGTYIAIGTVAIAAPRAMSVFMAVSFDFRNPGTAQPNLQVRFIEGSTVLNTVNPNVNANQSGIRTPYSSSWSALISSVATVILIVQAINPNNATPLTVANSSFMAIAAG